MQLRNDGRAQWGRAVGIDSGGGGGSGSGSGGDGGGDGGGAGAGPTEDTYPWKHEKEWDRVCRLLSPVFLGVLVVVSVLGFVWWMLWIYGVMHQRH